mgnify:CR=1 FL=1
MEIFHSWITTIVAAVLITGFLEMLLPESGLQKFVRVVLGIFIMITILNPLLSLINQNIKFEHVALKASGQGMTDLDEILVQGNRLKQVAGEMADEQYSQGLNKQIRALALLVEGVADAQAQVELEKKAERGGTSAKIIRIKVAVKTEGIFLENEDKAIKPIQVKITPENSQDLSQGEKEKIGKKEERLKKAIQTTVANFYNLTYEQVEVSILD